MTTRTTLHRQHALKLYVSTDMKARLAGLAQSLDRPLADVCRTLMWIGLPILEGLDSAQQRGTNWWVRRFHGGDREETIEETT